MALLITTGVVESTVAATSVMLAGSPVAAAQAAPQASGFFSAQT